MKLPDFNQHAILNQLRGEMNAQMVTVPSRASSRLLNPETFMALGMPPPKALSSTLGSKAPDGLGTRVAPVAEPSHYARNAGSRILTPIPEEKSTS